MAAYTRQSVFTTNDDITAALFNDEYNALVAVFNESTGHKHDGTAAEGPVIGLIGDAGVTTPLNKVLIDTVSDNIGFWVDVASTSVEQITVADGVIAPVTDSDVDLGTTGLRFKDAFVDSVTVTGTAMATTFSGALSGNATTATTAGTVTTAAQPAITSVGTLTSLTVSGDATAANVYAGDGTTGVRLASAGWIAGGTDEGYITIYGDSGASNGLRVLDTGDVVVQSGDIDLAYGQYLGADSGNRVYFDASYGITSMGAGDIGFIVDSNDNSTTAKFVWSKDATDIGSATEIMRLTEATGLTLALGDITASSGDISAAAGTLQSGAFTGSLVLGADSNATTLTDATNKLARVVAPHYTNAEQDVFLIGLQSTTSLNQAFYGGSSGSQNAVMQHLFYAASDTTTLTGTQIASLTSSKNSFLNDTIIGSTSVSPDGTLHVYNGSAGTITASTVADELVVESSVSGGISILTPSTTSGSLVFGTELSNTRAYLQWNEVSDSTVLASNKVGASLYLRSDNSVDNLTLSGASGSETADLAGKLRLENSKQIQFKDAGGTYRDFAYLSAGDNLNIGSTAIDDINFLVGTLGTALTLADTTGNATFVGDVKVGPSTSGAKTISVGTSPSDNSSASVILAGSNSALNWKVGANLTVGGALEFIPSTVGGGEIFSSPVMTLVAATTTINNDLTLSEGKVSITDTADETALQITSSAASSNAGYIVASSLTSGAALRVYSDSADATGRSVVSIDNTNVAATGATTLNVKQDAAQRALLIDQNGDGTALEIDSEATTVPAITVDIPTSNSAMLLRNSHASTPKGLFVDFSAASPDDNTEYALRFEDSTTLRSIMYSDGDWANHDGVYGTISDARLKEDFAPARSYWDDFKALKYQSYYMKSDIEQYGEDATRRLGLVAQEVEEVFPALVKHGETDDDMKSVKSSIIDGVVNSIVLQEAMERIEQLEALVAKLSK